MPRFPQLIFIGCIFSPFAVFIYYKGSAVSKITLRVGFLFLFLLSNLPLGKRANRAGKLLSAAKAREIDGPLY